jgi:hypothetical protein
MYPYVSTAYWTYLKYKIAEITQILLAKKVLSCLGSGSGSTGPDEDPDGQATGSGSATFDHSLLAFLLPHSLLSKNVEPRWLFFTLFPTLDAS